VSYMKEWVGGYNISLLSTLSQLFPSWQPELMSLEASLVVLGLGTLGGLPTARAPPAGCDSDC